MKHCRCSKQGDVTITAIEAFYRYVPLIRAGEQLVTEVTRSQNARGHEVTRASA